MLFVLLLCINHNCYLYMPSWGPDLVNKLILFYSIQYIQKINKNNKYNNNNSNYPGGSKLKLMFLIN